MYSSTLATTSADETWALGVGGADEDLPHRVDRQPGRQRGEILRRAPELGLRLAAVAKKLPDEVQPIGRAGRGDLDRQDLRQPGHAGVDQAPRFGDQHDRVAAVA